MYDVISIFWLIVGGLLEPLWLIALKRSNDFHNKGYAVLAIVVMIASPFCLSLAMRSIPVGISYAVWTGIGAVGAVCMSALVLKENITLRTVFFVIMIILGSAGLALLEGS